MKQYRKSENDKVNSIEKGSVATSAINSVAILMMCNLLSRLLGFVRDMVVSYKYGTSDISDVYYLSTNVVTVIFFAISAAISTTYLPIYSKAAAVSDENAKRFHNTLFTISLSVSMAVSILIYAFGYQITWLFAGAFDKEKFELTVRFIQIMSLSMFFNSFIQLIGSYLQYRNHFFFSGMMGSILNIGYIIGAILSDTYGHIVLAYSFLAIHILAAAMLYVYSKKREFKLQLSFSDTSGYMKQAWVLILPIVLGNIAGQFNEAIDKSMASGLSTGSVSSLNYANKLQTFSIGVFVASIVTVSFPKMSKEYGEGNIENTKSHIKKSIISIMALSVPIMFGMMVLASDIVLIVFGRGEFDTRSVVLTSGALIVYSVGLPATALREFFMKALFAMEDTKRPIIVDIIGLVANVIFNFIFIGYMQHLGLALGSSIANILKALLLLRLICKKIEGFITKEFIKEIMKIVVSSLVMLATLIIVNSFLKGLWYTGTFQLIATFSLSVLVSIIVYFIMMYKLKSKVFLQAVQWVVGFLNKISGIVLSEK